jgi:hypothetical protein
MNTPLVSRSIFWRYYGDLGRLTLLNVVWSLSLGLLFYVLKRFWDTTPSPVLGVGGTALGLAAGVILSVGLGWVAFGVFAGTGFQPRSFVDAVRKFSLRALGLTCWVLFPVIFLINNLAIYLRGVVAGSWVSWGLSFVAFAMLLPLLLSSIWILPMLFFRNDGVWVTLKRSLLMVVGYPGVTVMIAVWSGMLLALYWLAPVTGLLLGGCLLLAGPSTALEKLLWGYTITFQGRDPSEIQARWDEEAARGWRDVFKPWESKRS